jgi:hypothetical protein
MLPAQSAVWIAAALMSEPVRASGEGLGGLRLCLKCAYQSQLGHGVRPSPPVLPRRTWRGQARVMEYGACPLRQLQEDGQSCLPVSAA